MRIHPLVPFALAVASAAVPACADSAPLRANRRLQEEPQNIAPTVSHSGISLTPEAYTDEEEIFEAKKGDTPTVITGNAQGDGDMKGGKLKEAKAKLVCG